MRGKRERMRVTQRERGNESEREQQTSDVVAVDNKSCEGLLHFILKTMGEPQNEKF